jgi:Tol biopolymer transport system component
MPHSSGHFDERSGMSVSMHVEDIAAEPVISASPIPRPQLLHWLLSGSLLAMFCGLLIALVVSSVKRRPVLPDVLNVHGAALPLNGAPGIEQNPSWSPDGTSIAFSWSEGHQARPSIYVQRIGDTSPTRVTKGDEAEYRPVWSPDGREIAFIRNSAAGSFQVARISVADRIETIVGQFSFNGLQLLLQPGLDWSPDGRSLLIADKPSQTAPVRLFVVDLATGNRRPLTDPPAGSSGDLEGKFSPDGKLVAFHRGGHGDLYVVSTSGEIDGGARRLTLDNPGVQGIAWSRDSRYVLFGSNEGGHGWGIWRVSVTGSVLAPVMTGSSDLISPAVSPDGKHLAVEQRDIITNLSAISLDKNSPTKPFAPSSRQDFEPAYSPDGMHVVFMSTRSGSVELWLADSDGKAARRLTRLDGNGFPLTPSWSPDGTKIIFAVRRSGATNIAEMSALGGDIKVLTNATGRNISPFYDEGGRYIYYNSNADGTQRIWRMLADGADKSEEMFWDTPSIFAFSRPNHSMYYLKDTDAGLIIDTRDLATGVRREVFRNKGSFASPGNLCIHNKSIYMLILRQDDPSRQVLVSIDAVSGKSTVLEKADMALPLINFGCAVSPNGRTLLVPSVERLSSDIYLAAVED